MFAIARRCRRSFLAEVTGGAKGLPRAGLYQSVVGNRMTKYFLRTACPGFFDAIDQDLPRGAIASLETLVASTSSPEFMGTLSEVTEPGWFTQWKLATAKKNDFWKLERIHEAKIDTLYAIIGAQRGDSMKQKQFVELFGQHFVVSPEFAAAIKTPDFRERATKCLPHLFADGAVVRARVLVTVDQSICLNDSVEDKPIGDAPTEIIEEKPIGEWSEQKNVTHLITLEISLTPRNGKQALLASETILELTDDPMKAGDWKLADVNFVMADNYPLVPEEGPKE